MPKSRRSLLKQTEHDEAVKKLASRYRRQHPSATVYADASGFLKPRMIGSHRPDIIVVFRNGRGRIIEIETEDTINTEHARAQARSFRGYANLKGFKFDVFLAENIV
ncbi:hypothetical protein Asulf_01335 [Archaeoglobus sulfaticallidus PM70-1]|uniref:TnsA endonuclease N-terminal domain-containing protein n=1 Tax=Archaeoglobus sulfaticallidus PM70-1 TaxID=387631 RepID=N0BLA6_9EURY|nr:hypothetical protein [Archaeoglobus sulfaticallidus]AGK61326.1 hypothetical protein Asulf_01335 [Archaeoglobus sulfaticallidus PM70-1]